MKTILGIIVVTLLSNTIYSQQLKVASSLSVVNMLFKSPQNLPIPINIGGLLLEHQYSHSQVLSIMGTPQSYQLLVNHPDYEGVIITRIYIYNSNIISIYDNVFKHVKLVNSDYKLNNLVGVGDLASKIYELPHNSISIENENNGQSTYYLYFRNMEAGDISPLMFTIINGVITKIEYIYCDDV